MSMAKRMKHGVHSMHSAGWYRMLCLQDAKREVARRLEAEHLQVFREGHLAMKLPQVISHGVEREKRIELYIGL